CASASIAVFFGGNDQAWSCNGDAIRELRRGKIGVEKRHHDACAVQSQPDSDIFRAVSHHQAYDDAFPKAMRERPARIAIRAFLEIAETIGFMFGNQRGRIAMRSGDVIEFICQGAAGFTSMRAIFSKARSQSLFAERWAETCGVPSGKFMF